MTCVVGMRNNLITEIVSCYVFDIESHVLRALAFCNMTTVIVYQERLGMILHLHSNQFRVPRKLTV